MTGRRPLVSVWANGGVGQDKGKGLHVLHRLRYCACIGGKRHRRGNQLPAGGTRYRHKQACITSELRMIVQTPKAYHYLPVQS